MTLHPNTEFWNKGELITSLEKFNIDQIEKVDGDGRKKSNIAPAADFDLATKASWLTAILVQ